MKIIDESGGSRHSKTATPLGWYPWFPRDFASSIIVRSMSFTARAIYRELLDIQWENGCLTDVQRMQNIIGISQEQWSQFAPFLDELFPDGRNEKLHKLRQDAIERQERKKSAGQKSGEVRRNQVQKPKKTKRNEQVMNKCSTSVQQVMNKCSTDAEPNINININTNNLTLDKSSVETTHVWSIPDGLQTEKFMHSWSAFVQHRRQMRKPISAVGGKALLRKLEQHTVEVATAALDESLSNGWQGVFPEKVETVERPGRTRAVQFDNGKQSTLARLGGLGDYENE